MGQQVNYIVMPVIDYMPVILFIDSTSRANSCMIGFKEGEKEKKPKKKKLTA